MLYTTMTLPNCDIYFVSSSIEAYNSPDIDSDTDIPLDIGIHDIEEDGSAKNNDGFFEKGVLKALESEHDASQGLREVKVIGNGHCHSQSLI